MKRDVVLIAHDLRSCHNVGSLLRTADGLGVKTVFLTGYTPFPMNPKDTRLPHMAQKIHAQIHKTALGAENHVPWEHSHDSMGIIHQLKATGYQICALEQHDSSQMLPSYTAPSKVALLIGREVEGIDPLLLKLTDICLEIPMGGKKESFNVVQAAAMALYQFRFH